MSSTATAWPWNRDMPGADAAPPAGAGSILSKFSSGQTPDGTRLIRACGLSRLEVAQLAAMDFPNPSLPFRRVSIDPVRGVAVMMAPSRLHERIAARLDKVAEGLGGGARGGGLRVEQLRGTRWWDREGPQGAGAEANCAFYVGETAEAYIHAEALGDEQADAFTDQHPPDLVVEINISHTDEGKSAWYRRLSVAELWTVAAGKSPDWLEIEFLDLQAPDGPAASRESKVIPGARPADVKDGLRMLQDASMPVMEGPRRVADAFAQRLAGRMAGSERD